MKTPSFLVNLWRRRISLWWWAEWDRAAISLTQAGFDLARRSPIQMATQIAI